MGCDSETIQAAPVTPPAVGGIAVVQVVGRGALRVVQSFLHGRSRPDDATPDAGRLHFCRWVVDGETIDDVVIAVRRSADGVDVVDINMHGGVRIVQRVLMSLESAGIVIIASSSLANVADEEGGSSDRELVRQLARASTRELALQVVRWRGVLPGHIDALIGMLEQQQAAVVLPVLDELILRSERALRMLAGFRIVLLGRPNVGKSTLANALAGRDDSIVTDVPGTTRDWLEHAGAIDGVPCLFVDTAGVRLTDDLIESVSIERGVAQCRDADVVLHLLDVTQPSACEGVESIQPLLDEVTMLTVHNKCDQDGLDADVNPVARQDDGGYRVSALTGLGLDALREGICKVLGLSGWRDWPCAAPAEAQISVLARARDTLATGGSVEEAAADLKSIACI